MYKAKLSSKLYPTIMRSWFYSVDKLHELYNQRDKELYILRRKSLFQLPLMLHVYTSKSISVKSNAEEIIPYQLLKVEPSRLIIKSHGFGTDYDGDSMSYYRHLFQLNPMVRYPIVGAHSSKSKSIFKNHLEDALPSTNIDTLRLDPIFRELAIELGSHDFTLIKNIYHTFTYEV